MQKSDCIIGVEHVSKFFGDKAVLNDVNLSSSMQWAASSLASGVFR